MEHNTVNGTLPFIKRGKLLEGPFIDVSEK